MRTLVITAAVLLSTPAFADEATPWRVSIESDPSTFALSGFSGWAMAKPANTHHLRIGAGGFGIDFPSFLVPHLNRTGEDGWALGVRAAMGFVGYQFGDRRGLYIGAYAGYLQARHTRSDMIGTADRDIITVLPTIGYQWFPFHTGALAHAYLEPWAGATVWFPVGGTSTLGTHAFKDPLAIPLAEVHFGYEF